MNDFIRTLSDDDRDTLIEIDSLLRKAKRRENHYCMIVYNRMYTMCSIIKPSRLGRYIVHPIDVLFIDYSSLILPTSVSVHNSQILSVVTSQKRSDAYERFESLFPEYKNVNARNYNKLAIEARLIDALRCIGVESKISDGSISVSIPSMLKILEIRAEIPQSYISMKGDFSSDEDRKRVEEQLKKIFRKR